MLPIQPLFAGSLECALGISKSFWLQAEANYRKPISTMAVTDGEKEDDSTDQAATSFGKRNCEALKALADDNKGKENNGKQEKH